MNVTFLTPENGRGAVSVLALGALVALAPALLGQTMLEGDRVATDRGDLVIHPIAHATLAMAWNGHVIDVDPVGDAAVFAGLPRPDVILVTDIHGDHLSVDTLAAVTQANTAIIAPQAVAEGLPAELRGKVRVLANGESTSLLDMTIEAIPMYNTTEDRLQYHAKGRGNGYVLTLGGKRVYISGDTEDIPEMRALRDIDVAFVCFNLPYTMTEEQAASAVREFKPRVVYPYHYRGSDDQKFARLVGTADGIEVRLRAWY